MPCGATTILWATCENCEDHIDADTERGGNRGAIDFARFNGWVVRRNGEAYCPDCWKKLNDKRSKEDEQDA